MLALYLYLPTYLCNDYLLSLSEHLKEISVTVNYVGNLEIDAIETSYKHINLTMCSSVLSGVKIIEDTIGMQDADTLY